jgi:hypothetical protein
MKKPKITGIGCYAKPETLNRVLKKVLEDFIPEEKNLSNPVGSQPSERLSISRMLRDTFAPPTGSNTFGLLQSMERKHITGFFVWIEDRCLAISIFTRDDWRDRYTFTARLNGASAFQAGRLSQRPIPPQDALSWFFEQTAKNAQGTAMPRALEHRF